MREKTVYLSLGSNAGERESSLANALAALEREGVPIVARSSIYETEPQDVTGQPWFLNMAVECRTVAMPLKFLALLSSIEREIGRVRLAHAKRGPRPIDLDILLFGECAIDLPKLTVPHPRMLRRRFVLEPLLEIAPSLRHPVTREPLRNFLAATLNQQVRLKKKTVP